MKLLKFSIALGIAFLITFSDMVAQKISDLSKYNCFSFVVNYSVEGQATQGILLCINHKDQDLPIQYSNLYLLNKSQNLQLVCDSDAFIGVYHMEVSKDSKYLAINSSGEGHSWIEIYDLQKLIDTKKKEIIADIYPYPGNIDLIGWQNNQLIIESDINLILKNEGKELSDKDMFEKYKKFLFDLTSKKFKEYK